MKETACAVIVTYNRRELLRECLTALLNQTRPPDHILVVDNASTDGTFGMLQKDFPGVEVLRLPENRGGAGGFYEGIKRASGLGYDWLWLMDDDTIPERDALETLLNSKNFLQKKNPRLLCSRVVDASGKTSSLHLPLPSMDLESIYSFLKGASIRKIRFCSFVSVLIARDAIHKYGLPIKDFFIYADDLEYTARILKEETGFWVRDSIAVHKAPPVRVITPQNYKLFYFDLRNRLWILRSSSFGPIGKVWLILNTLGMILHFITKIKPSKSIPVLKTAIRDAFSTKPLRDSTD